MMEHRSRASSVRALITSMGFHGWLTTTVIAFVAVGAILHVLAYDAPAHATWAIADLLVLGPLAWATLRELVRGRIGVDVIALAAIVGSLVLGEYLAGAVIALMLSGGHALEEYAAGRAGRELHELASRAPRRARVLLDGEIRDVDAEDVRIGDVVIVRSGEVVPVDASVRSAQAVVDQSALTGEPIPVTLGAGRIVASGASNAGDRFEAVAVRTARDSVYASIVRMVEDAVARRAPMVRMADRYSVVFLIATIVVAGSAWAVSGSALRALAVLVVATPCPLILAPPVALVAGTSRAARAGIIVKGAAAIETLGRARSVILDKTGTITVGTPRVTSVAPAGGVEELQLLRFAGSIEQLSVHSVAEAITHEAMSRAGALAVPTDVQEVPGQGISGTVDGMRIDVGSAAYMRRVGAAASEEAGGPGTTIVHVAADASACGTITVADAVRPDALELMEALHGSGINRVLLATGDHAAAAQLVAAEVGIDEVHTDCTPQRKLELVHELRAATRGGAVIMVGDGVNDAPALAAADVGVAMGTAGATAASEAADAVIVSGRIDALVDAVRIGQRSTGIARQSIIAGMALSAVGMVAAALGYLPPVYGALTQEAIDLAVIFNAMRALSGPR